MPASAVAKRTPGIGGTLGWRFGASGETGTSLPAIATSSCGTLLEDRRIVRWPGSASRSRVPLPQADDENKKGGREGRPRNRGLSHARARPEHLSTEILGSALRFARE